MGRCPIAGSAGGLPSGHTGRGLAAKFRIDIAQEIETLLAKQSVARVDLDAPETAAGEQVLKVEAHASERWLNSDHVGCGLFLCPFRSVRGRPDYILTPPEFTQQVHTKDFPHPLHELGWSFSLVNSRWTGSSA